MAIGGYRLADEESAYLRSHSSHLIDWRPWSEEAFVEARRLRRPVLLSIGFSACHWCHEMARECFEDAAIARALNEMVIPVKVDREERPDIDARYQEKLAEAGGVRGWPLTLLLSSDGDVIGGGGYFPAVADERLPGFLEMVRQSTGQYVRGGSVSDHQSKVPQQAGIVAPGSTKPHAADLSRRELDAALVETLGQVDWQAGGLLGSPKFPNLPLVELWLRASWHSENSQMADAAFRSLDAICRGALFDHLDGGFSRYCTDRGWRRPHYEKMLGENAQFVRLLAFAAARGKNDAYADCAKATVDWMMRRLWLDGGGFGASLSAEAAGQEGGDRLWTRMDVKNVLGDEVGFLERFYVLNTFPAPIFKNHRSPKSGEKQRLDNCLTQLRLASQAHPRPERDSRMLADWNGHAIRGLAEAGVLLGERSWLDFAKTAWDAVTAKLVRDDGHLWHVGLREGGVDGLLEDYAALGMAALSLAAGCNDDAYLIQAHKWGEIIQRDFATAGGVFVRAVAEDCNTGHSIAGLDDDAYPSASALALEFLIRLEAVKKDELALPANLRQRLEFQAKEAVKFPTLRAGLLNALDTADQDIRVSICSVDNHAEGTNPLLCRALRAAGPAINILNLHEKSIFSPHAIVCHKYQCSLALRRPDDLAQAIANLR